MAGYACGSNPPYDLSSARGADWAEGVIRRFKMPRGAQFVGRIMIRRYASKMAGYAFGSNPPYDLSSARRADW